MTAAMKRFHVCGAAGDFRASLHESERKEGGRRLSPGSPRYLGPHVGTRSSIGPGLSRTQDSLILRDGLFTRGSKHWLDRSYSVKSYTVAPWGWRDSQLKPWRYLDGTSWLAHINEVCNEVCEEQALRQGSPQRGKGAAGRMERAPTYCRASQARGTENFLCRVDCLTAPAVL